MRTSFICLLLFSLQVTAQISIYDCNSYPSLQQGDLESAGGELYRPCVQLGPGGAFFNYGSDALLIQGSEIRINPSSGFTHFGPHNVGGYTHLQSLEKSDFDVAVMNYTNFTSILKYEKLEVGITLPVEIQNKVTNFLEENAVPMEEKINPFLEWEIKVSCDFTNLSTGEIKTIDGFYFRDYSRNITSNDWDDIGTVYPFRIRFSPPNIGKWSAKVKIVVGQNITLLSDLFKFNVIESGKHGYVKVHENNRNLQLENRMIYPVGHNFISPTNGVSTYHDGANPGSETYLPNESNKAAKVDDWMNYRTDISDYKNLGGRYFRMIQTVYSSLIEYEKKGNYYDRLHYAWEQDKLLDYCEANDMLIHYNLLIQEPLMKYGNYDLYDSDWSHYSGYNYNIYDQYPAYCYSDADQKEP